MSRNRRDCAGSLTGRELKALCSAEQKPCVCLTNPSTHRLGKPRPTHRLGKPRRRGVGRYRPSCGGELCNDHVTWSCELRFHGESYGWEARTLFVGVGDVSSVDDIIAEHRSIERALDRIQIPRMRRDEVFELLRNGARLGMGITAQAQLRIALLSQGLPHYAHLLALHAVRTARDSGTKIIEVKDVSTAISKAAAGSQRSLLSDLQKATTSPQKEQHLYGGAPRVRAMAKTDEFGFFYAACADHSR